MELSNMKMRGMLISLIMMPTGRSGLLAITITAADKVTMADTRYTDPPYFADNLIFSKRVICTLINSAPNGAKNLPLGAKIVKNAPNGSYLTPIGSGPVRGKGFEKYA